MRDNNDDLFFGKRGVSVKVFNNNINSAIAQLKRKSNAEGINRELRKREAFETNTAKRRRKLAEAKMRWKKKQDQINEINRPKKKITKGPQKRPINTPTSSTQ